MYTFLEHSTEKIHIKQGFKNLHKWKVKTISRDKKRIGLFKAKWEKKQLPRKKLQEVKRRS